MLLSKLKQIFNQFFKLTVYVLFLVITIIASYLLTAQGSVTDYISRTDELRFISILKTGLSNPTDNISNIYYATKGLSSLNEPIPDASKLRSCPHVENIFNKDISSEATLQALTAWSLLNCASILKKKDPKLYNENTIKVSNKVNR